MSTQRSKNQSLYCGRRSLAACLAPLGWLFIGSLALAEERPVANVFVPGVQINSATYLESLDGHSEAYAAIGAQLNLDRSFANRSVDIGLFADIELTTLESSRYLQVLGSWASYQTGRWQFSASTAHFSSDQLSGIWIYAGKLQYELRPGHKLALAAAGALRGSRGPAIRLVYKTQFAGRVSVALSIGVGSNRPLDYGAKTSAAWNLL